MASHAPNGHQGITIKTAPHGANKISSNKNAISSPEELLTKSCPEESKQCKAHLQSSFQPPLSQPQFAPLYASSNGFVRGAIESYNRHHHFVIRPEDGEFLASLFVESVIRIVKNITIMYRLSLLALSWISLMFPNQSGVPSSRNSAAT